MRSPAPSRPPALHMPSPEALGVGAASRKEERAVDWAAVHDHLDRLGATCFHLEHLPGGGCRITCLLPTNQPGRTHRIEAQAGSAAEAVHLTLAQAQAWSTGR